MIKEEVRSGKAPKAIGPYSQAVKIGRYVFLSGQIPIDPFNGELVAAGVG
ncbi:MAG TPA: Rid family hydrolase, partial [Thermodesulfobacteriota bacterium]|nr:Rid family hydrolase [Thermodesulfobacteriota bacterium]